MACNAVGKDGRIFVSVTPRDSWFYGTKTWRDL